MKIRFAPSPTGYMHYGNIRTALFNALLAQKHSADFLLRIEDTDRKRSKKIFIDALQKDLKWLGIKWQQIEFQSKRQKIYDKYFEKLLKTNQAYYCFCSEQQLMISRKTQLALGQPPRYDGTCRYLNKQKIQDKIAQGEEPTIRFKVNPNFKIKFKDLIKGKQIFLGCNISDFIICRADKSATFVFSNAIDDALMEVTHALRGEDHITNTSKQLMILQALELNMPQYGHFPLILGYNGVPLSKRNGSETIISLKKQGLLPLSIINYLARLGHQAYQDELLDLKNLALKFNLKKISYSPARHDRLQLLHWQKACVLSAPVEELCDHLKPLVSQWLLPSIWSFTKLIQPNILYLSDASIWAKRFFDPMMIIELDHSMQNILTDTGIHFFEQAINLALEKHDYRHFIIKLKQHTRLSGKKFFMPLRLAMSGCTQGPEMAKIYEFLIECNQLEVNFMKVVSFIRSLNAKNL